jgi:hypothetical protein
MIRDKLVENKATEEKIDEFNKKIRSDDGKLNVLDLKKLNSVYKREYIGMVMEDDKAIKTYLDQTHQNLVT